MFYEERLTLVKPGRLEEYCQRFQQRMKSDIQSEGGRVLCLLSGLIGDPAEQLLQVTSFPDIASWQVAQRPPTADRAELVEHEGVRLLRPVASRPKAVVPPEDRRPIYGYRRFFIAPADLEEFVQCTEEGIWPRIEVQGACILGMWTTVATQGPQQEVVLLTGYHGPAHWEETRTYRPCPEGFDKQLWERNRSMHVRRSQLAIRTWTRLMHAMDP